MKATVTSLLLLLWSLNLAAKVVVSSPNTPFYLDIAEKVVAEVEELKPVLIHKLSSLEKGDTLISIGTSTLQGLDNIDEINVIILSATSLSCQLAIKPKSLICIYYQVEPVQLVKMIDEHFSTARIGYLYRDKKDQLLPALKTGNKVKFIALPVGDDIYQALRRLRERDSIDMMLLSNEFSVYTSRNIRYVLEDLYRHRIPAIAMSQSLIKAGATLAIVPDTNALVKAIAKATQDIESGLSPITSNVYVNFGTFLENQALVKRYNIVIAGESLD